MTEVRGNGHASFWGEGRSLKGVHPHSLSPWVGDLEVGVGSLQPLLGVQGLETQDIQTEPAVGARKGRPGYPGRILPGLLVDLQLA